MPLPKVVFFDMDNTLVDHEFASEKALLYVRDNNRELKRHDMASIRDSWKIDFDRYWMDLINGIITLEESWKLRFKQVFDFLGEEADPKITEKAAFEYGNKYLSSIRPVPGSLELLKLLKTSGIEIGIITNNLERMQSTKLSGCGLADYVDFTLTSESCGIMKPDPRIFDIALRRFGTKPKEAVMVGDSYDQDIIGALKSGIPSVWFNRNGDQEVKGSFNVPILKSYSPAATAYKIITNAPYYDEGLKSAF